MIRKMTGRTGRAEHRKKRSGLRSSTAATLAALTVLGLSGGLLAAGATTGAGKAHAAGLFCGTTPPPSSPTAVQPGQAYSDGRPGFDQTGCFDWLGAYRLESGPGAGATPVFCIDGSATDPRGNYNQANTVPVTQTSGAIAYLIDKYGKGPDPRRVSEVSAVASQHFDISDPQHQANQLASNYGPGEYGVLDALYQEGVNGAAANAAAAAAANPNPGPFTITFGDLSANNKPNTTYTATLHVINALGNPVVGAPLLAGTINTSGHTGFGFNGLTVPTDANGNTTTTYTTNATNVPAPGGTATDANGTFVGYTIGAATLSPPSPSGIKALVTYDPQQLLNGQKEQRVIGVGAALSNGVAFQGGFQGSSVGPSVVPAPALTVGTVASPQSGAPGATLSDKVTVGGDTGESGTINATLFGPVPPNADGSPLTLAQYQAAPKQQFTAPINGAVNMGNGDVIIQGPVVTQPGTYGWAETATVTAAGGTAPNATATSAPTAPMESQVITPAVVPVPAPALTIGTVASPQSAAPGATLRDTVTVGGDTGESGTINATLFGPVQPNADGSPLTLAQYQAAPAQQFTAPINGAVNMGNGNVVIQGPVVTQPGTYGWAETATVTAAGGTAPNGTATSAPTAPMESQVVTPAVVTPPVVTPPVMPPVVTPPVVVPPVVIPPATLKTAVSQQFSTPGDVLKDTITVTGAAAAGGKVEAELYYQPFANGSTVCSTITPADWAAFIAAHPESKVFDQVIPVTGPGDVVTMPYTVQAPGCFTYAEVFTPAAAAGTPAPATVVTAPGDVTESSTAVAPMVTTAASAQNVSDTAAVTDTVMVTGLHGATGVVSGQLLGPVNAPAGATNCAGVSFAGATPVGSFADFPVAKDGSFVSGAVNVKPGVNGCYSFRETLKVDQLAGRTVVTTPLGVPSETVLATTAAVVPVIPAPVVPVVPVIPAPVVPVIPVIPAPVAQVPAPVVPVIPAPVVPVVPVIPAPVAQVPAPVVPFIPAPVAQVPGPAQALPAPDSAGAGNFATPDSAGAASINTGNPGGSTGPNMGLIYLGGVIALAGAAGLTTAVVRRRRGIAEPISTDE